MASSVVSPSYSLTALQPGLSGFSFQNPPSPIFSSKPATIARAKAAASSRFCTRLCAVSKLGKTPTAETTETVFFDGGAHYGDLVANLLLGFTLLWLPLTLAAVSRAFFLRYRFTRSRVTVVSGLTGQDRSDFPYGAIKDVQVVPRFVGEWGDIVITLKDGTKVDLRSVPRFREISQYCLSMAAASDQSSSDSRRPRGF